VCHDVTLAFLNSTSNCPMVIKVKICGNHLMLPSSVITLSPRQVRAAGAKLAKIQARPAFVGPYTAHVASTFFYLSHNEGAAHL
jgi:hypothetical protein